jgi:SAM-dependent methyltransferase
VEIKVGVEELSRALAARAPLSSEEVFGAEALTPPEPAGPGAGSAPSCHPRLSQDELQLLEAGYARLLGEGEFSEVLDLLGGSERFTPEQAAGSLLAPTPQARGADAHRRVMLQVAQDLDEQPLLPFEDGAFDAVLVTLDVGALRRPLEVFREVGRVLQPGGLVAVSFGRAALDEAHTRLWALAGDREQLMLAEAYIEFAAAGFTAPTSITLLHEEGNLEWREGGGRSRIPTRRTPTSSSPIGTRWRPRTRRARPFRRPRPSLRRRRTTSGTTRRAAPRAPTAPFPWAGIHLR